MHVIEKHIFDSVVLGDDFIQTMRNTKCKHIFVGIHFFLYKLEFIYNLSYCGKLALQI